MPHITCYGILRQLDSHVPMCARWASTLSC